MSLTSSIYDHLTFNLRKQEWGKGGGGKRGGRGEWEARVSDFFLLSIHI